MSTRTGSLLLTAITDNQDMIGLMLDIVLDITFQQGQQEPKYKLNFKQASNHWDEINMISDVLGNEYISFLCSVIFLTGIYHGKH